MLSICAAHRATAYRVYKQAKHREMLFAASWGSICAILRVDDLGSWLGSRARARESKSPGDNARILPVVFVTFCPSLLFLPFILSVTSPLTWWTGGGPCSRDQ